VTFESTPRWKKAARKGQSTGRLRHARANRPARPLRPSKAVNSALEIPPALAAIHDRGSTSATQHCHFPRFPLATYPSTLPIPRPRIPSRAAASAERIPTCT
jgi:hypothetical protein